MGAYDSIKILIDFVSDTQNPSKHTGAQTGDFWFISVFVMITVLCALGIISYFKFKVRQFDSYSVVANLKTKQMYRPNIHGKHEQSNNTYKFLCNKISIF